jgi:hypothetical protein
MKNKTKTNGREENGLDSGNANKIDERRIKF